MKTNLRVASRFLGVACAATLPFVVSPAARAQCGNAWLPGDGIPGVNGSINASTYWDPDGSGPATPLLVIAGQFTLAGNAAANNVAAFDPATGAWSAFGSGTNGTVWSLTTRPNGDLVAGGVFTTAGTVPASCVARWDGSAWSALGAGILWRSGIFVNALAALPSGDVVAAGVFLDAGGTSVSHIARWDGTSWWPLGAGLANDVRALLTLPNGDLIAGGYFLGAGGAAANRVARWDGVSWAPLGQGLDHAVLALARLPNGDLVAGGSFTNSGGVSMRGIARWNGASWLPYGTGIGGTLTSPFAQVQGVLPLPNGELLIGGYFSTASGAQARNLARWNGTAWLPLGSGTDGVVYSLQVLPSGDLVAAGGFSDAGGTIVNSLARWNGAAWSALTEGWNGQVSALTRQADGSLVAGGAFTHAGATNANRIARWAGSTWTPLGTGTDNQVVAVTTLANGDLLAGGWFTTAGGVSCNHIARWNGAAWSPLGAGLGNGQLLIGPTSVNAIVDLPNGDLVAGGNFTTAGGARADFIARWDGATWSPLGAGTSFPVHALATLPNGDLVAGGWFGSAGGGIVNNVARWDGTAWSALGGGTNGPVYAFATQPHGDLVAVGSFTTAGGVAANRVARWDGIAWAPLGTGTDGPVLAVEALPNGDLVVGGWFTAAGGAVANRIARWDGTSWSTFGTGMSNPVHALAITLDDLAVGGSFTTASGSVSNCFARLTTTCPASASPFGAGCAGPAGLMVLTAPRLPWIGGSCLTRCTGIGTTCFAFGVTGLQAANTPLSIYHPAAGPGCSQFASQDSVMYLPASAGTVAWDLAIPNHIAFLGVSLHRQVVQVDLGVLQQITGLYSSNGLLLTVGAF